MEKGHDYGIDWENKIGFVDGSIAEPALDDPLFQRWRRTDSVVAYWILNSLSKEMQTQVLHCTTAFALKVRFEQPNGPQIFKLKRDLVSWQQGSFSVSAYYAQFRSLWESLAEHKPAHNCHCGGVAPWVAYTEMEYVIQFLMGLNDSFSSIRGQTLAMDPIPPITEVFSLCVQDEKQREIGSASGNGDPNHAFAVKNADNGLRGAKKDRPLCAHCGLLGHTKEKCYKLHGYPPNYKKGKQPGFL